MLSVLNTPHASVDFFLKEFPVNASGSTALPIKNSLSPLSSEPCYFASLVVAYVVLTSLLYSEVEQWESRAYRIRSRSFLLPLRRNPGDEAVHEVAFMIEKIP